MRRLSERRRYVNAYSRCRRRIVFCYRTGYAAPPLRPHLKRALAKKHSLSRPCSRNPPSPDCDGTERPSKSLSFTTPEKAIAEKDSYSRAPLRNAAQLQPALLRLSAITGRPARTTKRFPSPRWASAIQIVRPLESTVDRDRIWSQLLFLAEFLETRIIPKGIEHRIQSEQRWSERYVLGNQRTCVRYRQ
jgi:hypothetical protein